MYGNGLDLKNLVNLGDWQKVQDSFSESLGIALRTVDLNGNFLTKASSPCRLFSKIATHNLSYSRFCRDCPLRPEKKRRLDIKKETNFKCPFWLDVFILPIEAFGNRIVSYIVVGPLILNKRKAKSEYAEYLKKEKASVNLEALMDALIEINVFSHSKIRSIIRLLTDIFSYMAQTGYHKKRLGEIAPEVIEMDPLFSRYYEEKVLNTLLNTCMVAFDVDSGSVMKLDTETNELHVKVTSRLDDSFVKDGSAKMGEGIAGMAAKTQIPIVLPKDRDKNGLSNKMKRHYIRSSMIVPFNKANKPASVYGVINLNIVRKDREFSQKDITLIKELTNLASVALNPVK